MTMRFLKCLVAVALFHLIAAVFVFGAFHLASSGGDVVKKGKKKGAPYKNEGIAILGANDKSATKTEIPSTQKTYKVKKGDSYWSIAKKYGVPRTDLEKLNDHKVLHPGDVLIVNK